MMEPIIVREPVTDLPPKPGLPLDARAEAQYNKYPAPFP